MDSITSRLVELKYNRSPLVEGRKNKRLLVKKGLELNVIGVIVGQVTQQQHNNSENKMDYIEINARIEAAKKKAAWTEYADGKVVNYNEALNELIDDIEMSDGHELSDYDCQKIADARGAVK